jgi:hypothetical protein
MLFLLDSNKIKVILLKNLHVPLEVWQVINIAFFLLRGRILLLQVQEASHLPLEHETPDIVE